jgi:hypothetical protein
MRRVSTWLYPFLLAVVPALHLVAANPGQSSLDDLFVVLAVVLIGCALVYALAAFASRGRWGGRLPPLVVLAMVLWFWGYVHVVDLVGRRADVATHAVVFPIGLAATLGAGWWLLRRPSVLDRVATFLTLTGGLVVGWSALSIGMAEVRSARALRESVVVRRLARPIRVRAGTPARPKRDIYLIVLDEYANAEVTEARYGFDNRGFLDSLRRLGFVVPVVHSNYVHTLLSIPSLLNASQLADISTDLGSRTRDPTVPNYLVENNRTVAFLQAQGYRFAFFPSLWWLSTRHNAHADLEAGSNGGFDAMRELGRTELRRDLRMASMLDLLHRERTWQVADADHLTRTFSGLARIPKIPGPVFAFAHVLSPHKPFTFAGNCRPLARVANALSSKAASPYVEQVRCLDRMVLSLVATLLRDSDVQPVILFQGDHGTAEPAFDSAATAGAIPVEAAHERLGAFGAYYLPDHGAAAFGDSVTVVNVLGNVLRYYLGADLPREPDDMYLSTYARPYAFRRAPPVSLVQTDSAGCPDLTPPAVAPVRPRS